MAACKSTSPQKPPQSASARTVAGVAIRHRTSSEENPRHRAPEPFGRTELAAHSRVEVFIGARVDPLPHESD